MKKANNKKKYCSLKIAGIIFVIIGIVCFLLKGFTPEYLDKEGFLHEYFFLLPIGFFFIVVGLVVLIITWLLKQKKK